MEIEKIEMPGVLIIKPKRYDDNRGWFMETYNINNYIKGFKDAQDNISYTKKAGTIRGIHMQKEPWAQAKIVSCIQGKVLDVLYDLRPDSPTYLEKFTIELSQENNYQLYIPRGIAHGFQTLTNDVIFMYKCDNLYNKESELCISYNDSNLNMKWPIKDIIVSEKDKLGLTTQEYQNSQKKVLLIGASGMLGTALKEQLNNEHYLLLTPSHKELDITNQMMVDNYFVKNTPDYVINCAAYTNVDKAEKEKKKCCFINTIGASNVTKACKKINSTLFHISTEYVFDGTKKTPYITSDIPNPVNYYGFTKSLAETLVKDYYKSFIIRTSWLYDNYGHGFPNKIINLANTHSEINVVYDQIGSPTYVKDLAIAIAKLMQSKDYGIYHITNKDCCSFYELAQKVCLIKNLNISINPISSKEFMKLHPTSVERPLNSRLDNNSFFIDMPRYDDALIRCLKKDNQ